ncbi:glycosyltransferase [Photobacterium piscicola]|uniref:Glycosyltransferase n=1 Tax=Photobacterium piscicola TaxID=1378299 RepID=A0ABU6LIT0_9GAMM|nr:glycosyltransferase [Photobacterium piscicola]MEC6899258.1 glycosyltransferase [Photobacterium piscicola]
MNVILHIHDQSLPPIKSSGGSNRLVDWLAIEQAKQGHKVYTMSPTGFNTKYYQHITLSLPCTLDELLALIPSDVEYIEHHGGIDGSVIAGVLARYPGSIQVCHAGKHEGKNNVFISKCHAKIQGGDVIAYNGVPVDDYIFREDKDNYLLFLAKVKRSKKGVDTAIKVAKKVNIPLIVAGGRRFANPETWFNWHPIIKPVGYINGADKFDLISKAKALLVPIRWEEPFGLTIVESMLSGTPVIAFNRGAMAELIIDGETGFLCDNENEMIEAIKKIDQISPKKCRDYAIKYFTSAQMCKRHLELLARAKECSW